MNLEEECTENAQNPMQLEERSLPHLRKVRKRVPPLVLDLNSRRRRNRHERNSSPEKKLQQQPYVKSSAKQEKGLFKVDECVWKMSWDDTEKYIFDFKIEDDKPNSYLDNSDVDIICDDDQYSPSSTPTSSDNSKIIESEVLKAKVSLGTKKSFNILPCTVSEICIDPNRNMIHNAAERDRRFKLKSLYRDLYCAYESEPRMHPYIPPKIQILRDSLKVIKELSAEVVALSVEVIGLKNTNRYLQQKLSNKINIS